jgi:hypothetical protein
LLHQKSSSNLFLPKSFDFRISIEWSACRPSKWNQSFRFCTSCLHSDEAISNFFKISILRLEIFKYSPWNITRIQCQSPSTSGSVSNDQCVVQANEINILDFVHLDYIRTKQYRNFFQISILRLERFKYSPWNITRIQYSLPRKEE